MRDSFIFYKSFYEAIKDLPRDVQGEIYTAIMEYSLYGKETDNLKPIARSIFTLMKPQIDVNNKRFDNGSKGGRPKKDETKPKPDNNQTETKQEPNKNDNVNDNYNIPLPNAPAREEQPPPLASGEKTLADCYTALSTNQPWVETVTMNTRMAGHTDFTPDSFQAHLKRFFAKLQNEGETAKYPRDAMSHFSRWLEIELKKQQDERIRAKTIQRPTSPPRSQLPGEIGAATGSQPNTTPCPDYSERF